MSYDLIAIDIDGTMITRDHIIAKPVLEAVRRVVSTGKKIVLCTGRPFPGAEPYMKELGLNQEGDYLITYHGALVQRTDTLETVIHHELNLENLLEWQKLTGEAEVSMHAVRNDGVYTNAKDLTYYQLVEPFVNNLPLRIRDPHELDTDMAFTKFLISDEVETIEYLAENIPVDFRQRYTILRSMPNTLEILNKSASKGQSLKELASLLRIPRERIMAIGDSGNDVDMIDYAGLGVAMGNAIPEVKEVADVITDSVEEFGVATAINRYFFNEYL